MHNLMSKDKDSYHLGEQVSLRGSLMAHAEWYTQETAGSFSLFLAVAKKFQPLTSFCSFFFALFLFFWGGGEFFSLLPVRAMKKVPLSTLLVINMTPHRRVPNA